MSHPLCAWLVAAALGAPHLAVAAEIVAPEPLGDGIGLAPAPWLDPAYTPPPSFAPRPKAVAAVPAINTFDNAAVMAAYAAYWNVAQPSPGFTGSVPGCDPGTISLAFQEWTITRVNFLRAMAGVPGDTTLDSSLNAQEQAAALIMSANNTLTHSPTSGMACYSASGASGAGSSNLALGVIDAIPLYMSDPGTGNERAGHRRWILHSAKDYFGLGVTTPPSAGALYTFNFGGAASVPNGIPWPPRGFVPLELFPTLYISSGQRWSFGLPGANFGSANVSVSRNGSPIAVNVLSRTDNGYGDNTIVWELPSGHSVTNGSVYDVSISGVGSAASTAYSYQILAFDPANNYADLSVTHVSAPATAGTDKDVVYTLSVSNAGPAPASPVTLTDTLPAGTTFVWASPGCTHSAGTVTCNAGTLASGASRQVKVVVRRATSGTMTNNVNVTGFPADPASNNTSSAVTTVSTSPPGTATLRYRLYSPVTKEHHFTTDLNEYNVLGGNGNWNQEGPVGKVLNNPGSFGGVAAVPYYRLYNTGTAWHHWTTDANEYYTLSGFPGWNAEGVDGYVLPSLAVGSLRLYRLLYPGIAGGLHHWTIDVNEYDTLIGTYGWIGEGGSGFVIQ